MRKQVHDIQFYFAKLTIHSELYEARVTSLEQLSLAEFSGE